MSTSGQVPFRLPLISQYLRDQNELSAVERFSQQHDKLAHGAEEPRYRALMPATQPKPGQQYAFAVNLDLCTGCKACVAACHSLNGLDHGESFRAVGLLHGGTAEQPVQQTVTAACHHCVDPACMKGCPVDAYEKDPVTGIVKHLDDQCIGCKYCTLTCPYEVPQYNAKLGIVRKCDMCSDRLSSGEAPACVQACPNEAIGIQIVSTQQALEDAQGDAFLPAAPSPGITVPTTTYTTERVLPRNLLPADFYAVRPSEQHRPLVVMLVLTQLSVGAFCAAPFADWLAATPSVGFARFVHAALSLGIGLLALSASLLHLGRPLYAFRAVLGLRHSWLSREIVAFGGFAGLAFAHSVGLWQQTLATPLLDVPDVWLERLGLVVSGVGLSAVFCSVMLYQATLRRFWSFSRTSYRFFMSTAVLGVSATIASTVATAVLQVGASTPVGVVQPLCSALSLLIVLKLVGELSVLLHLRDKQQSELKRSALLLAGELSQALTQRVILGLVGGLLVPWLLVWSIQERAAGVDVALGVLAFAFVLWGELIERLHFFSAVSAARMPGTLR